MEKKIWIIRKGTNEYFCKTTSSSSGYFDAHLQHLKGYSSKKVAIKKAKDLLYEENKYYNIKKLYVESIIIRLEQDEDEEITIINDN